ncbi:hypothetical protein PSTG_01324 [Puccinia striiformis f. sp. tritici PST-78]|uniref:Uncharacterized protein n=1 Tax=Puccinia striiformis f. sp. tritici PST-78 TaxID=1165861 RepID=A0A0L0W223_9BASI|nr:hypothetical protein PSTG_01324 [Puccinia striiformis f. sp. tritici PST-78]
MFFFHFLKPFGILISPDPSPIVCVISYPTDRICLPTYSCQSFLHSLRNRARFTIGHTPRIGGNSYFHIIERTATYVNLSLPRKTLTQAKMTDTFWRGVVLSSFYFLLTIQSSNARHHHHKPRGQQCRTAMSVLPVHFTFNNTAQPTAPTTTTAPASDPSKPLVIALTGIPWQYEGKPIKSTGAPAPQALTVTLPANQTTVPGATPSGDIKSTLCFDAGALYSCSSCNRILYGKECYKKIGPEELETFSSGEIACTKWYSRTGYAEGGGVTMCGAESGDVYQCSKDEDLTQCEPCVVLGNTSPP